MTAAGMLAQAGVWEFYQSALWGGAAIAVFCGVLSVFVVLRRMAFIGEGIAHGAFGGVGVALLVELALGQAAGSVWLRDGIVAAFCVASALTIGFLTRRARLSEDSAIGICLVAAMALGVILLEVRQHLSSAPTPTLHQILFGNLVFIRPEEVWLAWGLAALVVLATAALFRPLVFFSFDEEAAQVFGVPTALMHYGLLVVLALAIVLAVRSMGVILAGALLILPGSTGRMWSDRIGRVLAVSVLTAVGGMVAGFLLAVCLGMLSPEPVIVLLMTAVFAVSYVVRTLRRRSGPSVDSQRREPGSRGRASSRTAPPKRP